MFSKPIHIVADTSIFARRTGSGSQLLVYSMNVALSSELAMVLPLPVPPNSPDDAARFINLQGYKEFFTDMRAPFPQQILWTKGKSRSRSATPKKTLKVHSVGQFEASFVPTLRDFGRLDSRFQMSPEVWTALPQYADYGFAVFKLKAGVGMLQGRLKGISKLFGSPGNTHPSTQTIQPMALEFPLRQSNGLFFPTVHVHDGQVPGQAKFDHALYCQYDDSNDLGPEWRSSNAPAADFMNMAKTKEVVLGEKPVFQQKVSGLQTNDDIWVPMSRQSSRGNRWMAPSPTTS